MKHILLLVFLFCFTSLSAQSLIITTKGNPITGYEVEVSSSGVFYKVENNTDSPFVKLDKSNVLMIRHADGSVVNLSESTVPNTSSTTQNSSIANENSTQKEMNPDDYLDHEYNRDMIAKYNTPAKVEFANESDRKRVRGTSAWKYDGSIVFQHYATDDSQFASKDLIVSYHFNKQSLLYIYSGLSSVLYIKLENISNKTIFVDLANTFFVKNKHSEPYYTPGATSSTSATTKGGSVNLGGVAKAVGVGGSAGALASAVNVGGAKSNSETNIIYSQRIISMPPHSIYTLEGKDATPKKTTGLHSFNIKKGLGSMILFHADEETELLRGAMVEWDESSTPNKISNYLTYSFSENFEDIYTLGSTVYIKRGVVRSVKYQNKEFVEIPQITSNIDDNFVVFSITKWEE